MREREDSQDVGQGRTPAGADKEAVRNAGNPVTNLSTDLELVWN